MTDAQAMQANAFTGTCEGKPRLTWEDHIKAAIADLRGHDRSIFEQGVYDALRVFANEPLSDWPEMPELCIREEEREEQRSMQRGPTACPNCGWEDGWAGSPPCLMPWGGRAEDHAATYRGCKFRKD